MTHTTYPLELLHCLGNNEAKQALRIFFEKHDVKGNTLICYTDITLRRLENFTSINKIRCYKSGSNVLRLYVTRTKPVATYQTIPKRLDQKYLYTYFSKGFIEDVPKAVLKHDGVRAASLWLDEIDTDIGDTGLSEYSFRGQVDMHKICIDAIKEDKVSFLVITVEKAYVGISRRISSDDLSKILEDSATRIKDTYYPYHIFSIYRTKIGAYIKALSSVRKSIIKYERKTNRKLYKFRNQGKFSNKDTVKIARY